MKFDMERINQPKTAIHCDTEEKAKELLTFISDDSETINNNNKWYVYNAQTCYCLNKHRGTTYFTYSRKSFYEDEHYTILKFDDIITSGKPIASFPLIKVGSHYVPFSYRNYTTDEGTEEITNEDCYWDVNAKFPKVSYCKVHKKWKVAFSSPSRWDAVDGDEELSWYFDSIADIVAAMTTE